MPSNIKQRAARDHIAIHLYSVIYELIDDAKEALTKLLKPEIVETETGRLVVKGVFKLTKTEVICGGEVTKGKLEMPAQARILRGKDILGEATVTNLKRGPQDTKEVFEGDMCGISLQTDSRITVQEGDHIELFQRKTVARSL